MDPAARAEWRSMVNKHAEAFWHESEVLRQELEPIFQPGTAGNSDSGQELIGDTDLGSAVNHLFDLASSNDDAIRRSFSVSSEKIMDIPPVKGDPFWKSLRTAESLAAKIVSSQ